MYFKFLLFHIVIIYFTVLITSAPTPPPVTECKSCRGGCYQGEKKILNETETTKSQKVNGLDRNNNTIIRNKRESTIERRACVSRIHVELFVIPLSIAMIPVALCSLLLCACYCGPKETRGKMPEKMWGIKLSKKEKNFNKRPSAADSIADSIYEYHDNYCRRLDSKKTRFNTSVVVIETRRISEAEISLPSLSPKCSPTTQENISIPKALDDVKDETEFSEKKSTTKKITRFCDNVEILGSKESDKNEIIKKENCSV
uniref:Uncharacterized protein n=1 Tax=Parastrongyloides trichosuri TaxID=131310 RepID=A0A0N4ZC38_PARTI